MDVAFYIGKGTCIDRVIRWATRSPYSHVELVDDDGLCWSSSHRDGGVRAKKINIHSGNWEVLHVPWLNETDISRIEPHLDKKYDYKGILCSQMFSLARHSRDRWFCSELVAHAIGIGAPQTYSPGALHDTLTWMLQHNITRHPGRGYGSAE